MSVQDFQAWKNSLRQQWGRPMTPPTMQNLPGFGSAPQAQDPYAALAASLGAATGQGQNSFQMGPVKADMGWSLGGTTPNTAPMSYQPMAAQTATPAATPQVTAAQVTPTATQATGTSQPRAAATAAATPAATGAGSQYGYQYSAPSAGWNPWTLYNQGTNDGGAYQFGNDTLQWDAGRGNGQLENSRDRVWRWTLDALKAQGLDPGSAPLQTVQATFLDNVARLHRDIDSMKLDWNKSGFAGYAGQATGANGQPAAGGQPGQPANPVAPAAAPLATPATATPAAASPAATPGGGPPTFATGATGTPWTPESYSAFTQDFQDSQRREILRDLGYDVARPGMMGNFLADQIGGQVSALSQFAPYLNGGNGQAMSPTDMQNLIQGTISSYRTPGANTFGTMSGYAQNIASNPTFQNFLSAEPDESRQKQNMQNLMVLGMGGAPGLTQMAYAQALQEQWTRYQETMTNAANTGGVAPNNFAAWNAAQNPAGNPYKNLGIYR